MRQAFAYYDPLCKNFGALLLPDTFAIFDSQFRTPIEMNLAWKTLSCPWFPAHTDNRLINQKGPISRSLSIDLSKKSLNRYKII